MILFWNNLIFFTYLTKNMIGDHFYLKFSPNIEKIKLNIGEHLPKQDFLIKIFLKYKKIIGKKLDMLLIGTFKFMIVCVYIFFNLILSNPSYIRKKLCLWTSSPFWFFFYKDYLVYVTKNIGCGYFQYYKSTNHNIYYILSVMYVYNIKLV